MARLSIILDFHFFLMRFPTVTNLCQQQIWSSQLPPESHSTATCQHFRASAHHPKLVLPQPNVIYSEEFLTKLLAPI